MPSGAILLFTLPPKRLNRFTFGNRLFFFQSPPTGHAPLKFLPAARCVIFTKLREFGNEPHLWRRRLVKVKWIKTTSPSFPRSGSKKLNDATVVTSSTTTERKLDRRNGKRQTTARFAASLALWQVISHSEQPAAARRSFVDFARLGRRSAFLHALHKIIGRQVRPGVRLEFLGPRMLAILAVEFLLYHAKSGEKAHQVGSQKFSRELRILHPG